MTRPNIAAILAILAIVAASASCGKSSEPAKTKAEPAPEKPADKEAAPATPPASTIVAREVTYAAGDVSMRGYLVTDTAVAGKKPGVLLVHEWWGHNDYARKRARMLAELGYTALAVDMFGDGKQADHPKTAMGFVTSVTKDMAVAEARFRAAATLLEGDASTDPDKIAAIGYCFGGGIVLSMARAGVDLDAVVSFHGSLPTDPAPTAGVFKGKVLVAHGADDGFIKPETIETFKKQMATANIDMEFVAYEGAVHAFTNPGADALGKKHGIPLAYNKAADEKSWEAMKVVLAAAFASSTP